MQNEPVSRTAKNVLGTELEACGLDPVTGFMRDGCCNSVGGDVGMHLVCAELTDAFLQFSLAAGNDLVSAQPEFGFPGLKAGDRWCLCVERWKQALHAGCAPPIHLEATHISALEFVDLDELRSHAVK